MCSHDRIPYEKVQLVTQQMSIAAQLQERRFVNQKQLFVSNAVVVEKNDGR